MLAINKPRVVGQSPTGFPHEPYPHYPNAFSADAFRLILLFLASAPHVALMGGIIFPMKINNASSCFKFIRLRRRVITWPMGSCGYAFMLYVSLDPKRVATAPDKLMLTVMLFVDLRGIGVY